MELLELSNKCYKSDVKVLNHYTLVIHHLVISLTSNTTVVQLIQPIQLRRR